MNNNNYPQQKLRGMKRKYEAVQARGGKCERCGYSANLAALDFHHRNPLTKEFQIDMRVFSNTSLDKLKDELDKCELLCANCHREHHYPDYDMSNVTILTSSCDKNSFSSEFGSVCPVCGKRFPKVTGKTFCSKECMETNKHYPTKSEVEGQYKLLGTWEKVASHYGISRRVIQRIRAKDSNQEVVGSSPAGPTQLIVESNE